MEQSSSLAKLADPENRDITQYLAKFLHNNVCLIKQAMVEHAYFTIIEEKNISQKTASPNGCFIFIIDNINSNPFGQLYSILGKKILKIENGYKINHASFSQDNAILFISFQKAYNAFYDTKTAQLLYSFNLHERDITDSKWDSLNYVLALYNALSMTVFDYIHKIPLYEINYNSPIVSLAFNPDSSKLAVSLKKKKIVIYDLTSKKKTKEIQAGNCVNDFIYWITKDTLLTYFYSHKLRALNLKTGKSILYPFNHKIVVQKNGTFYANTDENINLTYEDCIFPIQTTRVIYKALRKNSISIDQINFNENGYYVIDKTDMYKFKTNGSPDNYPFYFHTPDFCLRAYKVFSIDFLSNSEYLLIQTEDNKIVVHDLYFLNKFMQYIANAPYAEMLLLSSINESLELKKTYFYLTAEDKKNKDKSWTKIFSLLGKNAFPENSARQILFSKMLQNSLGDICSPVDGKKSFIKLKSS